MVCTPPLLTPPMIFKIFRIWTRFKKCYDNKNHYMKRYILPHTLIFKNHQNNMFIFQDDYVLMKSDKNNCDSSDNISWNNSLYCGSRVLTGSFAPYYFSPFSILSIFFQALLKASPQVISSDTAFRAGVRSVSSFLDSELLGELSAPNGPWVVGQIQSLCCKHVSADARIAGFQTTRDPIRSTASSHFPRGRFTALLRSRSWKGFGSPDNCRALRISPWSFWHRGCCCQRIRQIDQVHHCGQTTPLKMFQRCWCGRLNRRASTTSE